MSLIDVENAKQIRDPMDVLIKMEVPEEVNLTYSGYSSSSKVADAVLDERGWPMRMLADLQGNGFQLNGACQLYDPAIIPSATNGKLGVRGNIGQRLSITVTGDTTINGLSIVASGTDAVHFNGQTAALSGGQVIIPVGASSITIEFDPLTSDTRAEVSTAMAGTSIQVTNDSLISCVVSLRSDLSIDNPTLPESEINIDMYNDVDISEVVATIQEDTPLLYRAGYVGDMSQERQFYISGQITWADNILSIHAVDAVHFLDASVNPMMLWTANNQYWYSNLDDISAAMGYVLQSLGVNVKPEQRGFYSAKGSFFQEKAVIPRASGRELMAFLNNVFKVENIPANTLNDPSVVDTTEYWFTYVDGGIPSLKTRKPTASFDIYEDDCGEISKKVEPKISTIVVEHQIAQQTIGSGDVNFGDVSWIKNQGAFLSFNGLCYKTNFTYTSEVLKDRGLAYNVLVLPSTSLGGYGEDTAVIKSTMVNLNDADIVRKFGQPLIDGETKQNIPAAYGGIMYTQVIAWNTYYQQGGYFQQKTWNYLMKTGDIDSTTTELGFGIRGAGIVLGEEEKEYSNATIGNTIEIKELLHGICALSASNNVYISQVYPQMAYESLLNRSNITGSFTWKGDPRMQPRDVVNFHRLDGTVEEITLENITLHHEGGGTYAEITYRKGIC